MTHAKFEFSTQESQYFIKFLERVKNVSLQSKRELVMSNNHALKCHPIDFMNDNVSERTFSCGEAADESAYQFSISANKGGRVHGYFVDNVFYIVWLDPMHALYPSQ